MPRPLVRLVMLLIAALGLYLVGNGSVALLDRDEPRYAQASRQMLHSGDWVVPRFLDDIRAKKPPLIYWAQASAMAVCGDNAFAARLPSALAIFACALILAVLVWHGVSPQHAVWTTLIFCSTALTIFAAKSALTDGVALLFTVVAQACLFASWRGSRSWAIAILLAVAIGLGVLTKGVILGILLVTILTLEFFRWLDRRQGRAPERSSALASSPGTPAFGSEAQAQRGEDRGGGPFEKGAQLAGQPPPQTSPGTPGEGEKDVASLRYAHPRQYSRTQLSAAQIAQAIVGLLIVGAMAGSWAFLVHKRSPEFLPAMFSEAAGHAFHGKEGHKGPPGMHLLFIWADFLPWSLLLPMAMVVAWKRRDEPIVRFALAAVIGPWLMAELTIMTKLPEYMLPTMPALAFLTADAIVRSLRNRQAEFSSPQFIGAARIWAVVLIAISLLPWLAALRFRPLPWVVMSLMTITTIAWTILVVRWLRHHPARAIAAMGLGMFLVIAILYGLYLPRAQFLRLSILAADALRSHGATRADQSVMVDYKEPSLAFYEGGTIRERRSPFIISGNPDDWKPWMVITREVWNRSSPQRRGELEVIVDFRGLSVADAMRDVDIMVVRKR